MLLAGAAVAASLMGCSNETVVRAEEHADHEHAHAAAHGGRVQAVGSHHVEAVIDKSGRIHCYVLGTDEAELFPIPTSKLAAEAQAMGDNNLADLTLRAQPQPGEPVGAASHFTGTLPQDLVGCPVMLAVTVPVGGKIYRVRFEPSLSHGAGEEGHVEEEHGHAEIPDAMAPPAALGVPRSGSDAPTRSERDLYFTPGGGYTEADIVANGPILPARKYRGIHANHSMRSRPGDRICPVTGTRVNPKFSWIIGGKTYQFCCPPCIEDLVRRAKREPKSILPPEAYVKRRVA